MKKVLLLAVMAVLFSGLFAQKDNIYGAKSLKLRFDKHDIFQLLSHSVDTADIEYNPILKAYSIDNYEFTNDYYTLVMFFYKDKLNKFMLYKIIEDKELLIESYKLLVGKYEYKYGSKANKSQYYCKWIDMKNENSITIYCNLSNSRIVLMYNDDKAENVINSLKIGDI